MLGAGTGSDGCRNGGALLEEALRLQLNGKLALLVIDGWRGVAKEAVCGGEIPEWATLEPPQLVQLSTTASSVMERSAQWRAPQE